MPASILESLVLDAGGKIVLLVLDGLGDLPLAERGGQTPLEAARTPNLDRLAPGAALGRLLPVAPGITPGSGPAHLALFGYDPIETVVGRGVLEALGAGMELREGDVAARANFCTVDGQGIVTDRRAGRITSETCARLVETLRGAVRRIEDVEVVLEAGKGHRFVALLRGPGLSGEVSDADPHAEGKPIPEVHPLAASTEGGGAQTAPGTAGAKTAQRGATKPPRGAAARSTRGAAIKTGRSAAKTARIANGFLKRAAEALRAHHPANAVLLRGLSSRPALASYAERFKLRAAAIAAYPMYRGVGHLAGMRVMVPGEKPADAFAMAASCWGDFDYFFIHIKGTDMAGEDGNFDAKMAVIETVDQALTTLLALQPDVLCVTGDHSTPVPVRGHSWHPVPLMVLGKHCGADGMPRFHEKSARVGSLGVLASRDLIAVLLANAGRLDKYGA